jgi:hypothetical protein
MNVWLQRYIGYCWVLGAKVRAECYPSALGLHGSSAFGNAKSQSNFKKPLRVNELADSIQVNS